ncbi:MAG: helix-turn-helix domain-containing protein [Chthoniobacteraceae bacterium]
MNPVPFPLSLIDVFTYRQESGKHPRPFILSPYDEWVEIVTGGHGWVREREGDGWHELLPGDLVWQAPGDESLGRSDFENPFRTFVVKFRVRDAQGMGMPRFSKWPDVEEISLLAHETTRLILDETFSRDVMRDYLFSKLIYQIHLHERSQQMTRYPAPIAAVILRIEKDFAQPLRLEELARESGWSLPHLHTEFQKYLKIPPHQMLIQRRLRVAKKRLVSTDEAIKTIAVECGFANIAAFSHAFKAHTGQTPSEYRAYRLQRG